MVHIPYAGAAPAAQALIGKTVELGTLSISVAMPQIQAGQAEGAGGDRRGALAGPAGRPDGGGSRRAGIRVGALARDLVPAGTPKEIVDRLAKVLVEIAQRPDVREKLRHAGFAATGRGPDAFAKRIADDVPKWKDVIEKARISVK